MLKMMKWFILALLLLQLLVFGLEHYQGRQGKALAERHLTEGKLRYCYTGVPRKLYQEMRIICSATFGIDYEWVGEQRNPIDRAFFKEYNDVMMDEMTRRFGPSFFDKVRDEANRRLASSASAP